MVWYGKALLMWVKQQLKPRVDINSLFPYNTFNCRFIMKFDPELSEVFTTEGVTFEFNHARTEYLSNDILDQYNTQMHKLGKIFMKAKKKNKSNKAENIIALHSEWNVDGNDETMYLVFNDDDNSFTHVTTENLFYSESNEVQE